MSIQINASLLAHIELDPFLQGRFGVQGNIFYNTFGYLKNYLQHRPNLSPRLKDFSLIMSGLVAYEENIDQIKAHPKKLNPFLKKTSLAIEQLKPKQKLLIPGGWAGTDSPGHAMIYQFERDEQGQLLFHIVNSGEGLQYHEKTSLTQNEAYSPVKTYVLPEPISNIELQNLIQRLVKPKLRIKGDYQYDAKRVYEGIDASLAFMRAQFIPHELGNFHATTASQLSGTCTQRSIHQLLKINFDTLNEYQIFILEFKLYALEDFLNTHKPPRSSNINQLLEEAMIHNARILQEIKPISKKVKESLQNTIERLNARVHNENTIQRGPFWLQSWLGWLNKLISLLWWSPKHQPIIQKIAKPIVSYELPTQTTAPITQNFQYSLNQTHLISDLEALIERCQKETNPAWVMTQIEHITLELPIPHKAGYVSPYYNKIAFYQSIKTADDYDKISHIIDKLQQLYQTAAQNTLHDATIPTQVVTSCSLLALRDYFDAHQEMVTKKPAFHGFLHTRLFNYLNSFKACTYLATQNPKADQRLTELLSLTYHDPMKLRSPNIGNSEELLMLIENNPDLKLNLEQHCLSDAYIREKIDEGIKILGFKEYMKDTQNDPEHYERNKLKNKLSTVEGRLKVYQNILFDDYNSFIIFRNQYEAETHSTSIKYIPQPLKHYKAIINSEPQLKQKLEHLFESHQYGNERLYEQIRDESAMALFILMNELDDDGNLKEGSQLDKDEFAPLTQKIKQTKQTSLSI